MKEIIVGIMLMIFPLLMYLVFSCYSVVSNRKIERIIFILTLSTSLYICFKYSISNSRLLLLCNIPLLICYLKKEMLFGLTITVIVILFSYQYDVNIYIVILKYICYFLLYVWLNKRKDFNYLFFKSSGIIQAFFITFEYFMSYHVGINELISLFIIVFFIYFATFFSLYLFKLADSITSLYTLVSTVNEENKIKNLLFKLTHEIKNPLAVCKGYIDMINYDDMDKCKKYIGIIKSELDRSLNVMADFVDYSKIRINKEEMDIILLLDDIYQSFEILMKDKNINFCYDSCDREIYIMGDYTRLKQVLVNIIKNSVEAIRDSGIIKLGVNCDNEFVTITIDDNGIGMTEEELNNVKEMFFTTKRNGTGLGVSLSNEIIEAHNGSLNYESIEGKGTSCIITIPL